MIRVLVSTLAVLVVMAVPAHGITKYSGASVGSNGTINGWGVTDAYQGGMWHTAYVTTVLTSPNERVANSGQRSGSDWVRADVYLVFDETDLGTYTSNGDHQYYCYYIWALIALGQSWASKKVYDFTVTVLPTEILPTNTGTGTHQTTVTVQMFPIPYEARSVSLQDVRIAGTGGHPTNHPATIPSTTDGSFSPVSGSTSSTTGKFTSTYYAPWFGGEHQIKATMDGRTKTAPINLRVKLSGLQQLIGEGGNYHNSNSPAGQIAHPDNWWGTATTLNGLVGAADDCAGDSNCNGLSVPYNDISLPWGGKFDGNSFNWTGGHSEHRLGTNCDVNVCEWTQTRKDRLNQHFLGNGAQNPILDECADPEHTWHVRW
jgi:hypothetical protein